MTAAATKSVLLSCLHQDAARFDAEAWPSQDDGAWHELLALAHRQRVTPLLASCWDRVDRVEHIPPWVRETLAAASRRTALRNLQLCGALARVAAALAARDIPVIVLKGAYLCSAIYPSLALRPMSDLDVLIRVDDLPAAVAVTAACGYDPVRPFDIDAERAASHHLPPLVGADAVAIEIHWRLTPPGNPHPIDPAALWPRAVPFALAGAAVLGLSLEDLLLHLCYHTSYQHQFQFGLRPFCDIAQVIARRGPAIDWGALVDAARTRRWERGVFLSFTLAHQLVGAAVPETVLLALAGAIDASESTGAAGSAREGLVATARGLVFAPPVRPNLARLVGSEGWGQRLGHLGRRLLLAHGDDAGVPSSPLSAQRARSALVRAGTLIRRDGRSLVRLLLRRDAALADAAAESDRLRRWLSA